MKLNVFNRVVGFSAIAGVALVSLTAPAFARGGGTPDGDCSGCGSGSSETSSGDKTPNTRTCGFVSHPDGNGGYRIFAIAEGYYSGVPGGRRQSNIAELAIVGTDTRNAYNSRASFNGVTKGGQPIIDADAFLNNGALNDSLYEMWAEGVRGGNRTLAQCAQDALNAWIAENGDDDCLRAQIIRQGKDANVRLNYNPD